ncbi:MAG: GIY-YIG nuclease family protein [Rhodobiaceae bacterium]|nr:GIY-YIG nuclease family protein [Rhodobiaceae bacterium]MCC0053668.1 GIY-YIG nuclease family protein [Rhodobiaceae bacterium]
MAGWVYIVTNKQGGTLYTGVTNDLARRVHEHRTACANGFTKRYGLDRLVWFERHDTVPLAIAREKQVKRWRRAWKIAAIEDMNPGWRDLFDDLNR